MKNRAWMIAAVLGVVFVVGGFLAVAVWQFLAPTDRRVAVPYTVGPAPDQAFLDTLKPTSSNDQSPRIIFEK